VDQISSTTPTDAPAQAQDDSQPADAPAVVEQPGFGSRGRARRRARFLRKARELAYRDLGGLVYNLHRFGQRNDELVLAKLNTLGQIDLQLRALDNALAIREPITVLREAGITACPRCAAIHSSEDRFCPNCGLSMARHVDLPIAGAAAAAPPPAGTPQPAEALPAPAVPQPAGAAAPPAAGGQQAPLQEGTTVTPPASGLPVEPGPPDPAAAPVRAPSTSGAAAGQTANAPMPSAAERAASVAAPTEARPGGEEQTEILRPGTPGL
jgi:hypothetical protein